MIPELRPYQLEAVERTARLFQYDARRVLIVAPTGGGKTVIASKIIQLMGAAGRRVVFLAHRRELIKQSHAKLAEFGVPAGIIMAGFKPSNYDTIQVASVQTLVRRSLPFEPDYFFFDECHHVTPTNAYGQLISQYPRSRIIGLTATPFRLDGQGLADIFPHYVVTRTPSQLRSEGFLAPVTGLVFRSLDTSNVDTRGGDFVQAQLASTENTILGDVVGEWSKRFRDNPVPTILFACGVKHSQQFVEAFKAQGIKAEHLDGTTPIPERDAILERVRTRQTHILSNCNVATEGFDLPILTCIILARPTKSLCMYLQQVGRVLRTAPGKHHAIIHDHANCLITHGTPYDESREYVPTKTKKTRDGDYLPTLTRCEKCGCITTDRPCPECGFANATVDKLPEQQLDNVEIIPLDQIEREQTELSDIRESYSFKRVNDSIVGILKSQAVVEGLYGTTTRFTFQGLQHDFYLDAPIDLRYKLKDVPKGTRVRIVFCGTETTRKGNRKKLFRVFIPQQLPVTSDV